MATVSSETSLASGYEALAAGSWEAARDAFQEAVDATDAPEALDGLGRALWWFRNTRDAVVYRERAYAGFRRDGELARAARIALWLSREYALVFANDAVASGWRGLSASFAMSRPGAERGWLALARSERTRDPSESARIAEEALAVAETTGDTDLELRALAQLGLAEGTLLRRRDAPL